MLGGAETELRARRNLLPHKYIDATGAPRDFDRSALSPACNAQIDLPVDDAQAAYLEIVEPCRQTRARHGQAPAPCIDRHPQHRLEEEEHAARCPGLWPARDGIGDRLLMAGAGEAAEQLGQAAVLHRQARIEQRGEDLAGAV